MVHVSVVAGGRSDWSTELDDDAYGVYNCNWGYDLDKPEAALRDRHRQAVRPLSTMVLDVTTRTSIAADRDAIFVATFQPDPNLGRILAAHGGVFVAGSLAWGVAFDGLRPDRFDLIGAAICLVSVVVIIYAPRD